jgi:hypothetical protein
MEHRVDDDEHVAGDELDQMWQEQEITPTKAETSKKRKTDSIVSILFII